MLCAGGRRGGFPGALPGVQKWDGEGTGGVVPATAGFARDPGQRFSGAGDGTAGPTRHRVSGGEGETSVFFSLFNFFFVFDSFWFVFVCVFGSVRFGPVAVWFQVCFLLVSCCVGLCFQRHAEVEVVSFSPKHSFLTVGAPQLLNSKLSYPIRFYPVH